MADHTFRTDQVGSLLRPPALLEARRAAGAGELGQADLRLQEDEAIDTALARQEATGIDVLVDGEFRRAGFLTGFVDGVEGFERAPNTALAWKGGTGAEIVSPNAQLMVRNKIRAVKRIAQDEAAYLTAKAPGRFKITLPSPVAFVFSSWDRDFSGDAYPSPSDFLADAADILVDEVSALGAEGVPYIQLDSPCWTHWADESLRQRYTEMGFDLEALLLDAIAAENRILAAAPDGVVTGIHLCRGNSVGRWLAEGGYDAIAERLFSALRCDRLLLEYDTDRSGGFGPLRFVPRGKVAVLGLVTTKSGTLEDRDELLRRIEAASQELPLDQLALSPQCGFASSVLGNPLTEEEQWAKLELIASVADEVWP